MKADFVLIVSGIPSVPRMDIMVPAATVAQAKKYTIGVIENLAFDSTRWTSFELYDTREETHVRIAAYNAYKTLPTVMEKH